MDRDTYHRIRKDKLKTIRSSGKPKNVRAQASRDLEEARDTYRRTNRR